MVEHNCEVWDGGYRAVALWEEEVPEHMGGIGLYGAKESFFSLSDEC